MLCCSGLGDFGLVVIAVPSLFLLVIRKRDIRRRLEEVFPELRLVSSPIPTLPPHRVQTFDPSQTASDSLAYRSTIGRIEVVTILCARAKLWSISIPSQRAARTSQISARITLKSERNLLLELFELSRKS